MNGIYLIPIIDLQKTVYEYTKEELRPGNIKPTRILAPNILVTANFVVFFDKTEFYIVKSVWTRENEYGKIEDLDELVNYILVRFING